MSDPLAGNAVGIAVRDFARLVLAEIDRQRAEQTAGAHPMNDCFGDHPERLAGARAKADILGQLSVDVRRLAEQVLRGMVKPPEAANPSTPSTEAGSTQQPSQ